MLRFYKYVSDGFIVIIGVGFGYEEISKAEYDLISEVIANRPIPEEGYDYRLKADLTWEKYALPPEPPAEADLQDFEQALEDMGVRL